MRPFYCGACCLLVESARRARDHLFSVRALAAFGYLFAWCAEMLRRCARHCRGWTAGCARSARIHEWMKLFSCAKFHSAARARSHQIFAQDSFTPCAGIFAQWTEREREDERERDRTHAAVPLYTHYFVHIKSGVIKVLTKICFDLIWPWKRFTKF